MIVLSGTVLFTFGNRDSNVAPAQCTCEEKEVSAERPADALTHQEQTMRHLKLLVIIAGIVVLTMTGSSATPARAEKVGFWTDNGRYYCVLNTEQTLGKAVCRNPYIFADYYVMYFDIDYSLNRVFIDTVISTPEPGYYRIDKVEMSIREWQTRYGR